MPNSSIYGRLLVANGGDTARARQTLHTIYTLLLEDKQGHWWYRELRERGDDDKARRLELSDVRREIRVLARAVYAHVDSAGWVIHKRAEYPQDSPGYETGVYEGHGGIEDAMIRCCLLLGVPVLDFTVPGCDIVSIHRITDAKRPHEVAPWYRGTLEEFIAECLAAGARLVNRERGRTEIYRLPIAKALDWQIRGTLREALADEAFAAAAWLQEAERRVEDAGGDYWSDRCLVVDTDGEDFVVYLEETK